MIINCPNCEKKFEIDKKLIPSEGRLLQCGSCNNKWFYKTEDIENKYDILEKTISEPIIKGKKNLSEEVEIEVVDEQGDYIESANNSNNKYIQKSYKKNDINFFKIIIVIIISFFALVLVLDTFKEHLSTIIPNIDILLDNLYQSINDIKLFILDLIK